MTTPTPQKMPDVIWAWYPELIILAKGNLLASPVPHKHPGVSYTRTDLYQAVCAERDALRGLLEGMEFKVKLIKSWFVDANIHTKDVNAWMKNGSDLCDQALTKYQAYKEESDG